MQNISNGMLRDRRVVVIGGSSGIGLATARAAAAAGAEVIVVGRSAARLNEAVQGDPRLRAQVADAADPAAIETLFDALGEVDHVALMAGGRAGGRIATADLDALRADMDTRFWGAVAVCRSAAPRIRSGGSITLCSGAVSIKPAPGRAVVSGMVRGVEALGRALALELAPIRVNTVVPGVIDSPRVRSAFGDAAADPAAVAARIAEAYAHLPAGRAGQLDEIAHAFLFAMTNGYFTGQSLVVDGGYTLT